MTKIQKEMVLAGDPLYIPQHEGRGSQVYSITNVQSVRGKDKDGNYHIGQYVLPMFILSREERISIFQSCDPVHAIVTGRMNRIAGLEWHVTPHKDIMDAKVQRLEDAYRMSKEFDAPALMDMIVRGRIYMALKQEMPELKKDMSNFNGCLLRWKRRIINADHDYCKKIEDWLSEPTQGVRWSDFLKKYVFDQMIHGNATIIKMPSATTGLIENFDILLGGTTVPLATPYAGSYVAYAQINPPLPSQIFFADEISYRNYIPTSARPWGFVPLECLVNRISEYLFFDRKMADQADGTKPPDKAVVFGQQNPFGTGVNEDYSLPLDEGTQKQLEEKLNAPRKNAIAILTGTGTPMEVDLTRDTQNPLYQQRQAEILKSVALIYGATNNEINLTGSNDTSGRSTSEAQERTELARNIAPQVKMIEEVMNNDILPYRWGTGYRIEAQGGLTENAELDKYQKLLNTGWSVNDIMELQNKPRYDDPEADSPFIMAHSKQQNSLVNGLFGGGAPAPQEGA